MGDTAIVTSSTACVPPELVRKYDIRVVPFTLIIDGRAYLDGIDISTGDFYRALISGESRTSTSAPSVGDYLDVFHSLEGNYRKALCITIASGISTAFMAAANAAARIDSMTIEVFDSGTAATGQAWVAIEAARLASEGRSLEDILQGARSVAEKVQVVGALGTLEYLKRSGRVNAVSAFAAGALNIKPVFRFQNGEARTLAKTLSWRRAVERMAREAVETARNDGPLHLSVFHALAEDEALKLKESIEAEADCAESFTAEFTPVMGRHTGPGLIGAGFY